MRLHQLREGFSILPKMDREKYQERDGLEGPIMTRSGKVVYYDPKEGMYYDPDTDMYLSYDDWKQLDSENMHKVEAMSDEDKEKAMKRALQKSDEPERGEKSKKVTLKKAPWEESVQDCDCECGEDPCKKCGKTHHENVQESEDKPYICVHAKKGKHECHAGSSYEAAKKAAAHWKLKSTSGIDAHLAVDEGFTDVVKSVGNTFKRGFKSLTNRNNRPAKPPQPNQHTARVKPGRNTNFSGTSIAQKINWGGKFESADNSAMDKALRSIEKTFGSERTAINDQVTAMCRAADMLGNDRFKDRALSVVEQYGIDSKHDLLQELHMMIKNEAAIDDEEIYGADTNIKMMKSAIAKLRGLNEAKDWTDKSNWPVGLMVKHPKPEITQWYKWDGQQWVSKSYGIPVRDMDPEIEPFLDKAGAYEAKRLKGMPDESIQESQALTEEQFDEAAGEKDACYRKVKSRYKVWPSAYASGALVKCRKVGAANWGNSKKK